LLDVLRASGYLKSASHGTLKPRIEPKLKSRSVEGADLVSARLDQEKIRRFIRRFHLSAIDAELLLGMIRQVRWRMLRRSLRLRRWHLAGSAA